MKELTLHITGMSCIGCENTVRRVITQLNGVSNAIADYRTGEAVIKYNPSQLNIEQIISVVNETGYRVESTISK